MAEPGGGGVRGKTLTRPLFPLRQGFAGQVAKATQGHTASLKLRSASPSPKGEEFKTPCPPTAARREGMPPVLTFGQRAAVWGGGASGARFA